MLQRVGISASTSFRSKAQGRALGWHSPRRKFENDTKADAAMADFCYLGGWKSPLTVMTVYQQADEVTMRNAVSNRDLKRAAAS
jgi:hypothetical protein